MSHSCHFEIEYIAGERGHEIVHWHDGEHPITPERKFVTARERYVHGGDIYEIAQSWVQYLHAEEARQQAAYYNIGVPVSIEEYVLGIHSKTHPTSAVGGSVRTQT